MLHFWCKGAAPLVPGCCAFTGTIILKVFTPFFLFVDRQYQRRIKSSFFILLQQDLSMRVWGWCEGKKLTLTLALTLFVAVCQSVTAKSEGVRVEKQKLFFSNKITGIPALWVQGQILTTLTDRRKPFMANAFFVWQAETIWWKVYALLFSYPQYSTLCCFIRAKSSLFSPIFSNVIGSLWSLR